MNLDSMSAAELRLSGPVRLAALAQGKPATAAVHTREAELKMMEAVR